jgi:hypothetical protein
MTYIYWLIINIKCIFNRTESDVGRLINFKYSRREQKLRREIKDLDIKINYFQKLFEEYSNET